MIRTVGQCVVALEGVGVEVIAEGSFVAIAEELAEVGAAESVAAVEAELGEVVMDAVVVYWRHS